MEGLISKTTAVFAHPFTLPGFDEKLPAGEYDLETELAAPLNHLNPNSWKAEVRVHLHPRMRFPGLARSLTVSLADLDSARARDKLSGEDLAEYFLEEMLADPMVRLVMQADGVSETQLHQLFSGARAQRSDCEALDPTVARPSPRDLSAIAAAENEGMPVLPK